MTERQARVVRNYSLDWHLVQRLDREAERQARTRSYLVGQALERYLGQTLNTQEKRDKIATTE